MSSPEQMTNDQCPNPNGGSARNARRPAHLVIGSWSFPRLFANAFENNAG